MSAKEAVVCLVDVSASMGESGTGEKTHLGHAVTAIDLFVQQKMLFNKKDEIGLVLFGTDDTENDLNDEMGTYEHVTVLQPIDIPTLDFVRGLSKLKPSSVAGDFLDGLVVSLDLLHKRTDKKRYQKRIILVTDAASQIKDAEDIETIMEQTKGMDVTLQIIAVDFRNDIESDDDDVKAENQKLLSSIVEHVHGDFIPVTNALEMMGSCRKRSVKQVTGFRGEMEIGSLRINTYCYTQTRKQALPSLKKESQLAPEGQKKVQFDRIYKSQKNPDEEVPVEERIKAYKYGQQMVPFSSADEQALKFETIRELKVIGFCPTKAVPRHHYMTGVDILVAPPGDVKAQTALSALIHALQREKRMGIVRLVKRKNANPLLGCVTPYISEEYECLHFNVLPFAEDLREFIFAPLDAKSENVPTAAQCAAAETLVTGMSLMPASHSKEELCPGDVLNPVFQRFYSFLKLRALDSSALVPSVDPTIKEYMEQSASFDMKAATQDFRNNFKFKQADAKKNKGKKRFWSDVVKTDEDQVEDQVKTAKLQESTGAAENAGDEKEEELEFGFEEEPTKTIAGQPSKEDKAVEEAPPDAEEEEDDEDLFDSME